MDQVLFSLIQQFPPYHTHIQSYEHLITFEIPELFQNTHIEFTSNEKKYIINFNDVVVLPCTKTVLSARNEKDTLVTQIIGTITERVGNDEYMSVNKVTNRQVLAEIPVMVGSSICPPHVEKEVQGYFVVNGIERVLVIQERKQYNYFQVFYDRSKEHFSGEIRSISEETTHSCLTKLICKKIINGIDVSIPHCTKNIPITTVMEIIYKIEDREARDPRDEEGEDDIDVAQRLYNELGIDDHSLLLSFQKKPNDGGWIDMCKTEAGAEQIIRYEIFPHIGLNGTINDRKQLLLHMVRKLYNVMTKKCSVTDRDNLAHKRMESSGNLLYDMYKILLKNYTPKIEEYYSKNCGLRDIIEKLNKYVSKNIRHCMSTGRWGIQKNAYVREGVSQMLQRVSYLGTLSHLQRLSIQIGNESKNSKIRQIHPSKFGYICIFETPEGQSCGIVMNLTILTIISLERSANVLWKFIKETIRGDGGPLITKVFINNIFRGNIIMEPSLLTETLRHFRETKRIFFDISIHEKYGNVNIFCDKGRLIRPVMNRDEQIIWLDASEMLTTSIATCMEEHLESNLYDYTEIHPSALLGICANCIPYLDHNQSPRNVYESAMMKQAIGMFSYEYKQRTDALFYTMNHTQRSFVSTVGARALGVPEHPAGINCVTAISVMHGENCEDSLVINQSAIDRGLFVSTTFQTISVLDGKGKDDVCKKICMPPLSVQKSSLDYSKLGPDGVILPRSEVGRKTVLVGRTILKDGRLSDCSEICDEEKAYIERVIYVNQTNYSRVIEIVLKKICIPEIGDKFANLYAQKGTCGSVRRQEDMPFTSEGITPDIIINPNAIPSRMTISMLLDMVAGKYCSMVGELIDGTAFTENSHNIAEELATCLGQLGYENMGWERMYNGETGNLFRAKIAIGFSYYQKLKHMVADKIYARSHGPITTLVRQPPTGRSNDGGLRIGPMEVECLLSQGSVNFLRERMFDLSDPFYVLVCPRCKVISNYKQECHLCKENNLANVSIPYVTKLIFQYLEACGMKVDYVIDDYIN